MADILIVEDGLHERERLAKLFAGAHFTVSSAESVQEAERLLALESFRLTVLDIGLGDKSGSYLFEQLKRSNQVPYIVVLTGNPSVHLKQRFLDEGAAAYVVKASQAAENDSLLDLVRSLLGESEGDITQGIPLADFLRAYVNEASRELFLDEQGELAPCAHCGEREFTVSFGHRTQLPPMVEGRVICSRCRMEMDPKVG